MKVKRKPIISFLLGLGVIVLVIVALIPAPVKVEVSQARKGPLRVTVDEEGETRAHDRFVVAAPVAGRLSRIELDDGDNVALNEVIAIIDPLPLSPRERSEVTARVEAAEALKREADARAEHARADYDQARREGKRAEQLARDGLISPQSFEQVKIAETTSANELEAARFKAQAAASEV
jgi:HlyD family secretion protein